MARKSMARKSVFIILIAMAVALITLQLGAWGNEGHTWINEVAAAKLASNEPNAMPKFFSDASARLGWLGPEPDRWRNQNAEPELKWSQETDHFIDMEALPADFGDFPSDRYRYIKKLYEARAAKLAAGASQKEADALLPEKIGFQPYITMEVYERLRVAFREYRHTLADIDAKEKAGAPETDNSGKKSAKKSAKKSKAKKFVDAEDRGKLNGIVNNIILYAGWLGHYVGDASQPLHTSVKYDGWVGDNPNGYVTAHGIHSQFETKFVKDNLTERDFADMVHAPTQLKNVRADYIAYLKESNSLVEPLYKLEKAGAFTDKGTPEGREFAKQRLAAGAQMLANMWYTAWMESAVDPPDPYADKKPATTTLEQKK